MKKTAAAALALALALAGPAWAGGVNGWWLRLTVNEQLYYVAGFMDGMAGGCAEAHADMDACAYPIHRLTDEQWDLLMRKLAIEMEAAYKEGGKASQVPPRVLLRMMIATLRYPREERRAHADAMIDDYLDNSITLR